MEHYTDFSHDSIRSSCSIHPPLERSKFLPIKNSRPGDLRHPEVFAYRCFLPDLAEFTSSCRTGPGLLKRFTHYRLPLTTFSLKGS